MADDVATGAFKYLGAAASVTSLLGAFSPGDPIVANANQPYLFTGNILVNLKGTSVAALVCSDMGGWQAPPMLGTQRFRRLRVDIYVDPSRDSAGNVTVTTADTVNRGNRVATAVHVRLHRRDPDTVLWGDLVTFGCQLLTEPVFSYVSDGDGMQLGTAVYGVYVSGWTDLAS